MDLVDGYEELPPDVQDKVKRAIMQGHVDDADWKGVSLLSNTRRDRADRDRGC